MKFSIVVLAFALFLASCGSGDNQSDTPPGVKSPPKTPTTQTETPEPEVETETEAETPPAEDTPEEEVEVPSEVTLELAGSDEMKFDKRQLKVPAGSEVTLILTHSGKMTKEAMGHNFVLLKQGTSIQKFGAAAVAFKDNDYLPKDTKDIIVHTRMLGGGESDTIVFQAPPKGKYDYICSYPGHYAMMKGKFIVE